jgi:hypothetical protein
MRTLVFLSLLGISSFSFAQTNYNKWSLEAGIGGSKPSNPYSAGYHSNTICFPSIDITSRYMMNSYFGAGLEANYSIFRNDNFRKDPTSLDFKTNYVRISFLATVNLGQIMDFHTFSSRLGLLSHVGIGWSSLYNDSLGFGEKKGGESMMNIYFGLTPQFKINERFAVKASFRAMAHMYQEKTYDLQSAYYDRGLDGFLLTGTLGLTYFVGKEAQHIDWYDPRQHYETELKKSQQKYDSLVKALADDDHDGVANYLDGELTSAPDAVVDIHGVTIRNEDVLAKMDDDIHFLSDVVEFPDKMGLFYTVQVGYYSMEDTTSLSQVYDFDVRELLLPNGQIRVVHGYYKELEVASKVREAIFNSEVIGAFVTAYYKGRKIGLAQAERLLFSRGNIILEPSAE